MAKHPFLIQIPVHIWEQIKIKQNKTAFILRAVEREFKKEAPDKPASLPVVQHIEYMSWRKRAYEEWLACHNAETGEATDAAASAAWWRRYKLGRFNKRIESLTTEGEAYVASWPDIRPPAEKLPAFDSEADVWES